MDSPTHFAPRYECLISLPPEHLFKPVCPPGCQVPQANGPRAFIFDEGMVVGLLPLLDWTVGMGLLALLDWAVGWGCWPGYLWIHKYSQLPGTGSSDHTR